MLNKRFCRSIHRVAIATLFVVVLLFGALTQAQTFTTLYNFTSADGSNPNSGVVQDKAGKL